MHNLTATLLALECFLFSIVPSPLKAVSDRFTSNHVSRLRTLQPQAKQSRTRQRLLNSIHHL